MQKKFMVWNKMRYVLAINKFHRKFTIFIFDSDLVQRIQLITIKGKRSALCVQGTFNLKCLLIEYVILNLRHIYFCIPEIFKTNVLNLFLSTKSLLEFMFQCCEVTKVIIQSKSSCEMFVLCLSSIQTLLIILFALKNYYLES